MISIEKKNNKERDELNTYINNNDIFYSELFIFLKLEKSKLEKSKLKKTKLEKSK